MANKINQNNFDKLLHWLGASAAEAANEYEHIRRVLIKIFLARGFSDAEDLTDITIDRVASKIDEIETIYTGEKIFYFLSVAKFIRQEALRKKEIQINNSDFVDSQSQTNFLQENEQEFSKLQKKCLKECFSKLKERHKTVILEYYDNFGEGKILHHRNLAEKKSVTMPALRNQVYRIKIRLSDCVKNCSGQNNL
ncbi:MAG: hypothetical protein M3033_18030 [Acidobacteriota bacterium]|nr:hypothetical protein [Acidobacteriota bacterium]